VRGVCNDNKRAAECRSVTLHVCRHYIILSDVLRTFVRIITHDGSGGGGGGTDNDDGRTMVFYYFLRSLCYYIIYYILFDNIFSGY